MKAVLGMTTLVVFGIGPVYRGKALGLTSVTSVITWAPDITRGTTLVTRVTLGLLYTSDAADEDDRGDHGRPRIININKTVT